MFAESLPVRYFETLFLKEADKFIAGLDPKAAKKVFYNLK